MSELNLNTKDENNKQVFITPRLTVSDGKKVVELPRNISLKVAYVVKALIEGKDTFKDVTKTDAGNALFETLSALPANATLDLYLPLLVADRESNDLAKWKKSVSGVKVGELAQVAQALHECSEVAQAFKAAKEQAEKSAMAEITRLTSSLKVSTYEVNQPVYSEATARAKKAGSKITITI